MQINFTYHAIRRIEERSISLHTIVEAINAPDKIEKVGNNVIKFLKYNPGKQKILICICKIKNQSCTIITAFESSQIHRYLK